MTAYTSLPHRAFQMCYAYPRQEAVIWTNTCCQMYMWRHMCMPAHVAYLVLEAVMAASVQSNMRQKRCGRSCEHMRLMPPCMQISVGLQLINCMNAHR